MKKLLFSVLVVSVMAHFKANSDVSIVKIENVENNLEFIEVYSSDKINEYTYVETVNRVDAKGNNIVFKIYFNKNQELVKVDVSDNANLKDIYSLHSKLAKYASEGSLTKCTRNNRCSDKPTNAGVLACIAECMIDSMMQLAE